VADIVKKYLETYAEPEGRNPIPLPAAYDFTLVVPCFEESPATVRRVWQNQPDNSAFLAIIVVNSQVPSPDWALELAGELGPDPRELAPNISIQKTEAGDAPDILIVDLYHDPIDARYGVGLARKTGMDVALRLFADNQIRSDWLFTTDADALLPADYFTTKPAADDVALLYPFVHQAVPGFEAATISYEIQMLYYAAGLKWAGSPYGFPTVGSTICCKTYNYASVRGVPKRNTGEDFYLLDKLRKQGNVKPMKRSPIELDGRLSKRVPVGTGRAIEAIGQAESDYQFEHPDCFDALRDQIRLLQTLSSEQPSKIVYPDRRLEDYCRSVNLDARYQSKRTESPSPTVMYKHLIDWFDGLRTRQFVHRMRDQHFGTVTREELTIAPFLNGVVGSALDIRISLSEQIYQ
jgi:hypothetical protein